MVYYPQYVNVGTDAVTCLGDGITINVKWFQAIPEDGYSLAYHIYYSTSKDTVFTEGVKFVSIDSALEANIIDLIPGQEYFFAVRPVEYNPYIFTLSNLPIAYDNLRVYPSSLLRADITDTDTTIPLLDVTGFPPTGIIKVGAELIQYLVVDTVNNDLILASTAQRGFANTTATSHTVGGWDGTNTWDPAISIFTLTESKIFDRIFMCQTRFEYPNYSFTLVDGYKQVEKDILTSDLSAAEAANLDFPMYDYAGYHRTDPVQLLNGTCVGSYIGGEMGCIDGYGNVNMLRGLSLQDQNNQRQEVLLSVTGRPAVLIKMVHTGIVCSCYLASGEYPDDRCPKCYGTKFVYGYEQFFNPRRSDGRILVRVGPTDDTTKMYEAGYESEFAPELWTLAAPIIKQRDIIVLFDEDNNEEFRYEVMSVNRNNTTIGQMGGQKLRVQRIRKTDPTYQVRIFRDTSTMPSTLNTSIGFTTGIPPHTHQIVRNETDPSNWSQTTSVSQGHNHPVVYKGGTLVVLTAVGHDHKIIIP